MHYRHSFHAGNFADVFKHTVLCALLAGLSRKDKPWSYLETHAGAGRYDLQSAGATRTGEWQNGIGALWAVDNLPAPLAACREQVRALNPDSKLRHYPGSPLFALALARADDRVVLCEKVPEVAEELRIALGEDARVILHRRDGYDAYSLLPPPEKRGLVLVDPPFERPDEFDAVAGFLEKSLNRFPGGVHAMWYPLKNRHAAGKFERRVGRATDKGVVLEIETGAAAEGQMRACGMIVVNPPYGFEADMEPAMKVLVKELALGPRAAYRMAALVA